MCAKLNLAANAPDTRWAWVEIDQAALRHNTKQFKNLLAPHTQLMCVVKADAYGHGAVACARIMLASGADQLGVSTVAEGVELRQAGITAPILILSEPPETSIPILVEYDLMPSIYTEDFALQFGEYAAGQGKVGKYHLAIETGMNRIGVLPAEVLAFRQAIDFHSGLECAGTFTHFATADEPGNWDFELQANRFEQCVTALQNAGFETGLIHCDNTPATILHPKQHFDMVRVGIGLYGLDAAATTQDLLDLKPVMSVRARVTRVEWPDVGEGVSYGHIYRVPKHTIQIATLPLGYADGLSRTLSGEMDVLVHGKRAHQVGAICMDQCMFAVEVTTNRSYDPTSEVAFGDVVTILGIDGDEYISADEHARMRGTINYEVTCNFGMRLEKVYV